MTEQAKPREMAIKGTHDVIVSLVEQEMENASGQTVLDIGAGQGSLSEKLKNAGFSVVACDLFPENFKVADVECLEVDADGRLPFENASIDLALAIELVEHIESHRNLFSEVNRILKPGGKFVFSTPNIASLKSRITFLLTGYFYSFGTLRLGELNPAEQHITPFTLDRYMWFLDQCGLKVSQVQTDKLQRSSFLWLPLWPLIRMFSRAKQGDSICVQMQNSWSTLFGRKLLVVAQKKSG